MTDGKRDRPSRVLCAWEFASAEASGCPGVSSTRFPLAAVTVRPPPMPSSRTVSPKSGARSSSATMSWSPACEAGSGVRACGEMTVNEQTVAVKPGDVVRVEAPECHNIANTGDGDLRLIFIKCPYIPSDKVDM